jgi:hypothetical protein
MGTEQIQGEFTFGESMRLLKMAFPRYFQNNALNVQSGETAALLALLEKGHIQCGSRGYHPAKNPEELQDKAKRIAGVLRKSSYIRALRNALHVFSGYQPDLLRTMCGALYYPELKLYVFVSYLTPKTLLSLFAEPDCEQVAVFTAMAKWGRKNHYLLFKRCGPWAEFGQLVQSFDLPFLSTERQEALKPEDQPEKTPQSGGI